MCNRKYRPIPHPAGQASFNFKRGSIERQHLTRCVFRRASRRRADITSRFGDLCVQGSAYRTNTITGKFFFFLTVCGPQDWMRNGALHVPWLEHLLLRCSWYDYGFDPINGATPHTSEFSTRICIVLLYYHGSTCGFAELQKWLAPAHLWVEIARTQRSRRPSDHFLRSNSFA